MNKLLGGKGNVVVNSMWGSWLTDISQKIPDVQNLDVASNNDGPVVFILNVNFNDFIQRSKSGKTKTVVEPDANWWQGLDSCIQRMQRIRYSALVISLLLLLLLTLLLLVVVVSLLLSLFMLLLFCCLWCWNLWYCC